MGHSVTYPRFVWIACSLFIAASLDAAFFAREELRVWSACAGCPLNPVSFNLQCLILLGGGVWVVVRTYVAVAHWLTWWYRRGHWLPPARPALETCPTSRAVADSVWAHPDFGVLRPWANLSLYCRVERIELVLYALFGSWVWWQLSECHQCPGSMGNAADACGRYAHLALAPFGVLLMFAILRAYFGPLPEHVARHD